MALELYHSTDLQLKNITCSLNDDELQISEPCLFELKQRTGITLDPYGNTKLYQNQIRMMIQCLQCKDSNNNHYPKNDDFLLWVVIKKLSLFDDGLVAIGD